MVRTEHDIVSQVRSAKTDPEAADALIRQYMGFIRSETVKFLHTAPENGHEDELSIAMLAFYEAVLAYEKSRGAFLPYACLLYTSSQDGKSLLSVRHRGGQRDIRRENTALPQAIGRLGDLGREDVAGL